MPKMYADKLTGVDAVLFDLDGTLVDSAPDLGTAANQMRIARGLSALPLSDYRPMVGSGARGMIAVAFDVASDDSAFEVLRDEFLSNYQAGLTQQTTTFAGVEEVINSIRAAGLVWGVVTNKAARFTKPLTESMAIFGSAGTVISGDTTTHAKPHPAPLLLAASELGVDPSKCIYVGDDERDMVAGAAAGMRTVAAAYGYLGLGVDYHAWNADAAINVPVDLTTLLNLPRLT